PRRPRACRRETPMRPPDAFRQAAARSARAGARRSAPRQRRGRAERFATRSTARLLQGAVAVLVFLARSARTHLVASDLGYLAYERHRGRPARPGLADGQVGGWT